MFTKLMKRKEKGFTLIELMIVIAIIGILAAIAIPQFAAYRVRAYNSAAESDLKAMQTSFEVFFNDNEQYPVAEGVQTTAIVYDDGAGAQFTFNTSNAVYLGHVNGTGTGDQAYGAAAKCTPGNNIYQVTSVTPTLAEVADTKGDLLADADRPAIP